MIKLTQKEVNKRYKKLLVGMKCVICKGDAEVTCSLYKDKVWYDNQVITVHPMCKECDTMIVKTRKNWDLLFNK